MTPRDPEQERALLQEAVTQGFVSLEEIQALTLELPEGETPTVDLALRRGFLSPAEAQALAALLDTRDASGTTRSSQTPATFRHYTDLLLIGAGGMGKVFRAHDPALNRTVAIKLMKGGDEEGRLRFLREARLQARVDHPHVCKVFEAGEESGELYIVMQYLEGKALDDALKGAGLAERIELFIQVSEGVHAAHRVGLVHRDLKPGNILVTQDEHMGPQAYVLDFGLARDALGRGLTETGIIMGTPAYMAPEQIRASRNLDARTDVYGLGATFYHALAGRAPFAWRGDLEALQAMATEDPASLKTLAPGMSPDLAAIIAKAMEKDPERRYPSALSLAEDLRALAEGRPISARAPSLHYRARKWIRRNRLLATAAALVATMLLAGGWVQLRTLRRNKIQTQWAERFGRESAAVESQLRLAYAMPRHDIQGSEGQVRDWIANTLKDLSREGGIAKGPGYFALGRIYLLMGDSEAALASLRLAWSSGFRTSEAAQAMGMALTQEYRRRLRDPQRGDPAESMQEAEDTFRRPAQEFLSMAGPATDGSGDLAQSALLQFKGDPKAALELAHRARVREPWRTEAWLQEAQILESLARASVQARNEAEALARYREAESTLLEGERISPSAPQLRVLRLGHLEAQLLGLPLDPEAANQLRRKHMEVLSEARELSPKHPDLQEAEATFALVWAQYVYSDGRGQALNEWRAAVSALEAARRDQPNRSTLVKALTLARYGEAQSLQRRFEDASEAWKEAERLSGQIEVASPNSAWAVSLHAYTRMRLAEEQLTYGKDPRPELLEAILGFERAIPLVSPKHPEILAERWRTLGDAEKLIADCDWFEGKDPVHHAEKALRAHRRRQQPEPVEAGLEHVYRIADDLILIARARHAAGGDWRGPLSEAHAEVETRLAQIPKEFPTAMAAVRIELAEGQLVTGPQIGEGGNSEPLAKALVRARATGVQHVELEYREALSLSLGLQRSPVPRIDLYRNAVKLFEKTLQEAGREGLVWFELAELHSLWSRRQRPGSAQNEAVRATRESLNKAISLNPLLAKRAAALEASLPNRPVP